MNPCFESMTSLQIGAFRIRVWREEATLEAACATDNADLHEWAGMQRADIVLHGDMPHILGLIGALKAFPRVAAVEIVDLEGAGVVVYNDWP